MSLVEMQSALTRLYTDGPFLEWFCLDPKAVLDHYELTPEEASAITELDQEAVRKFAFSLRLKTWGRFKHPYRLVHALDTEVVRKYYMRFYELRPIRPNEAFYGPNLEFGEFLERSFRDNPEVPPYASDLARYERLFYLARFEPRPAGLRDVSETSTPDNLTPAARPRLRPGLRLARFDYPMGALEKQLKQDTVPEDVEAAECFVVFQSFEQVGRARKFQVSAASARLLELCDGTLDIGGVAGRLQADPETVLEATLRMVGLGLLEVAPQEGQAS